MINVFIKIKRNNGKCSYYETFLFKGDINSSIASVLEEINSKERLINILGNHASPILWECGCLQKKCGACAMVINGVPSLACSTFF